MIPDVGRSLSHPELDPSMLIGVPSIDREHHALVSQLNRLIDDARADTGSAAFSEVLSQLGRQINAHFDSEEGVLRSCGMPIDEVAEHIQAHNEIIDQYATLNLDLMQGRQISRAGVLLMIKGWIVDHLLQYDTKIRKYFPAA